MTNVRTSDPWISTTELIGIVPELLTNPFSKGIERWVGYDWEKEIDKGREEEREAKREMEREEEIERGKHTESDRERRIENNYIQ